MNLWTDQKKYLRCDKHSSNKLRKGHWYVQRQPDGIDNDNEFDDSFVYFRQVYWFTNIRCHFDRFNKQNIAT